MKTLWFTLGPASLGRETELLLAGATGARLTFSYGTPDLQRDRAASLRAAADSLGRRCLTLADLPGGKFRLGELAHSTRVEVGDRWRLTLAERAELDGDRHLPVPDPRFLDRLRVGDVIVVGDGPARLEVVDVADATTEVAVVAAGLVEQRRGLTVVDSDVVPECLTAADLTHLEAIGTDSVFDAVALSFVSTGLHVHQAREVLGGSARDVSVVAKIETYAALASLDDICAAADGVVAARGDLALALPLVELPGAVQSVATAARRAGVPWYLATGVADGSAGTGFPTRAEICDLALWCQHGCSGVLLSHETAFATDPVAAVSWTADVLRRWGMGNAVRPR